MFRTVAIFAASVAVLLAATPAHADIRVGPYTDGSGAIWSGGVYVCPSASLGPGVIRPCQDIVSASGMVTLTAIPKADPPGHWRFVRWDGSGCGATPTCTIEATDGYFFPTAVFRDSVAPTISATVQLSSTRDRAVTLGWTSDESVSATCTLNGAELQACPDEQSLTLPEGAYTYAVRGRDLSENLGTAPPQTFRILETVLVSAPPTTSSSRAATFTVSSGLGTTFDCTLDGRFIKTCATKGPDGTGTVTLPDLADGAHTLRVYAVDGQDADTVPLSRTWTVDTVAPEVALVANDDATFSFTSNEATARFDCRIDAGDFVPCVSGLKPSVDPGEHRFAVRAVDRAGNVGAAVTRTWSVAAPAPAPGPAPSADDEPEPPRGKPALLSTFAGRRKVDKHRTVIIATIACPAGARCAITVPKTTTVKIAGKRYTVKVTKTKTRVGLELTKAAYARLKGRTGSATVRVAATATGAATTRLTVGSTLSR